MARVLIVDDSQDILTLVSAVAERMGLVAERLNVSARFIKTFLSFDPDIIVLDIMMPQVNGIEIIHWLVDVDYRGHLIIMSGYADQYRMSEALAEARGQMSITSLRKPFRIAELRAALTAKTPQENVGSGPVFSAG